MSWDEWHSLVPSIEGLVHNLAADPQELQQATIPLKSWHNQLDYLPIAYPDRRPPRIVQGSYKKSAVLTPKQPAT